MQEQHVFTVTSFQVDLIMNKLVISKARANPCFVPNVSCLCVTDTVTLAVRVM